MTKNLIDTFETLKRVVEERLAEKEARIKELEIAADRANQYVTNAYDEGYEDGYAAGMENS